jgi:hypothetical protein
VPPVSIEIPILNSPFSQPTRHLKFDDGITNEIAEGRPRSTYFILIAKPKVKGGDAHRPERAAPYSRSSHPVGVLTRNRLA